MSGSATLKRPGVSTAGTASAPPRGVAASPVPVKAPPMPAKPAIVPVDDDRRLMRAGLVSLGVHGAVAAALFVGLGSVTQAVPMAAMVVEMAELPAAPPVPPMQAPPNPEQKEAEPEPVKEKLKLPPIPKLAFNVKPEVAVPVREEVKEKKEQADKPAEETTQAAAPEAPVKKDLAEAPRFGNPSNTPSNAEASWNAKVQAAINRKLRYPAQSREAGRAGIAHIRLTMDRRGRVLDAFLRRGLGDAALDAEAVAVARRAGPYPAPPPEIAGDPVKLLIPVIFDLKRR